MVRLLFMGTVFVLIWHIPRVAYFLLMLWFPFRNDLRIQLFWKLKATGVIQLHQSGDLLLVVTWKLTISVKLKQLLAGSLARVKGYAWFFLKDCEKINWCIASEPSKQTSQVCAHHMHSPFVCEYVSYVHERVTKQASLAVWCISLNKCHISYCRNGSEAKSWARGWQSLALMDKAANHIFSTTLSSVNHSPEAPTCTATIRTQLHIKYKKPTVSLFVCSGSSLPLSSRHMHAHMLLQRAGLHYCVYACMEVAQCVRQGVHLPMLIHYCTTQ